MSYNLRMPRRRWRLYKLKHFRDLPRCPGVYVIFGSERLLYIGESEDMANRLINGHGLKPCDRLVSTTPWGLVRGLFVKIRLDMRYGERLMREARLLKRLHTQANIRLAGGEKPLRRSFSFPRRKPRFPGMPDPRRVHAFDPNRDR